VLLLSAAESESGRGSARGEREVKRKLEAFEKRRSDQYELD
jgi:hypothetical protein